MKNRTFHICVAQTLSTFAIDVRSRDFLTIKTRKCLHHGTTSCTEGKKPTFNDSKQFQGPQGEMQKKYVDYSIAILCGRILRFNHAADIKLILNVGQFTHFKLI
jgi:hypothetical protein